MPKAGRMPTPTSGTGGGGAARATPARPVAARRNILSICFNGTGAAESAESKLKDWLALREPVLSADAPCRRRRHEPKLRPDGGRAGGQIETEECVN